MLLLNESVTSQFIDINAIIPDSEDLQHHKVKVRSNQSDMHIVIHPENITVHLEIYIKHETPPTLLDYAILGEKQCCTAEVSYTLDDLESRLDLMMASVDAMCKGYLPMEDDLDDYDWLLSNRELD
ncbi:uncharacterized protein LOC123564828 isoform X2 [Mercenaria mercenaria]|nr:uncharacterized protein LOC123564828 isoform X2 [Mercenaria mercenaria]